ncbi:nucleobindin-2-like [Strongylocentrotus purpuratus]|uniref:Uncharacterized protein n=1 Tax=Strongylocentrotus purpuratus TaxID=7668 RepID=A0A7M7N8U3_STRPU|nr:nucleobindin-2-like [Strongylocentrotus purpuratus]
MYCSRQEQFKYFNKNAFPLQESDLSPAVTPDKVEKPDEQIEELQNIKKDLEQKLSKAENESSKLVMKNQVITKRVKDLEKLVKETVDQNIKLESEIKKSTSRPALTPGVTEKLNQKVDELQKERKELEEKLQMTEQESKDFAEKAETAMEKVKEMEGLKKEAEEKIKELEFEIKSPLLPSPPISTFL